MNLKLTQRERILVAALYLALLVFVYHAIGGDFDVLLGNKTSDSIIWFFSGALMIVMGAYIVEPYFTKPSDAIANSVTVLVALLGVSNKDAFYGYDVILGYALLILFLSILSIVLKDSRTAFFKKASGISYWVVETAGRAKVIFSVVYLSASYSYFSNPRAFVVVIAFWVVLTFFDVIGFVVKDINRLLWFLRKKGGEELGTAIGCENPFLYKVEMDLIRNSDDNSIKYGDLVAIETSPNVGSIGMVINKKYLLSKRWLSVYLFRDENGVQIKIDLRSKKLTNEPRSIFTRSNFVFRLDLESLSEEDKSSVKVNPLYKNRKDFVGYVTAGSNINIINFTVIRDSDEESKLVSEGAILSTTIYGNETLYQIINGNTREEHLENFDIHGYVVGIARKLGRYDFTEKSLDVIKWVPSIYSPLFFNADVSSEAEDKRMAKESIGHLPSTNFEIPIKDIDAIVTHNTAILGILGIGKSCLTFELISKVIEKTETKVVCFDITGEYQDSLTEYGCDPVVLNDAALKAELAANYGTINKDSHRGGNHAQFRGGIENLLTQFFNQVNDRVLVINPEDYDVSKQTNDIKPKKIGPGPNDWQDQAPMADLTLVEKTRIISEEILEYAKDHGKSQVAKYFLIFEEAHSLVPEWNSVANEGDKSATNGIAKVILQGRKYGLGSLVITQRTANVSKSILNQCNTIFAMRVFDDTGKSFLSNYIGVDYVDVLSTLDERHAIAIGKGLKLKQPVIIQLNDRANVITAEV
jgi:energy-converting hydrogenase Eha subunit E